VDAKGRSMGMAQSIPADQTAVTCCYAGYKVDVSGFWPMNYANNLRLAVTARSKYNNRIPFTQMTGPLADLRHGQLKTVSGSVTLTLATADATAIANNRRAKAIFGRALASTLSLQAHEVVILAVYLNNVRVVLGSRRLTTAPVRFDYRIQTSNMAASTTLSTSDSSMMNTLGGHVQARAAVAGVSIAVPSAVAASTQTASTNIVTTTTTTTTVATTTTTMAATTTTTTGAGSAATTLATTTTVEAATSTSGAFHALFHLITGLLVAAGLQHAL
jgi:cell division septation protein DedD